MRMLIYLLIFVAGCAFPSFARGIKGDFTDQEAVRAIVGECAGEFPYDLKKKKEAMFHVAWAIKNRGTLRGVYGLKAKHVKTEPKWIFDMARLAWHETDVYPDITFGADSWYSKEDIIANGDPQDKQITTMYGNHTFYKTITRRVSK